MSLLLAARCLYAMDYLKIIVFFIFLLESCNARQQGYNAAALPYKYSNASISRGGAAKNGRFGAINFPTDSMWHIDSKRQEGCLPGEGENQVLPIDLGSLLIRF
jgi:hypothetical protein